MAVSILEYEKALKSLSVALLFANKKTDETEFKIARDACIQGFEFCVELAWKTSLKKLGLPTVAPKPAIREMAQSGLIDNVEKWFEFIEARNKTSHSYDEEVAKAVFSVVRQFLPEGEKLFIVLQSK